MRELFTKSVGIKPGEEHIMGSPFHYLSKEVEIKIVKDIDDNLLEQGIKDYNALITGQKDKEEE